MKNKGAWLRPAQIQPRNQVRDLEHEISCTKIRTEFRLHETPCTKASYEIPGLDLSPPEPGSFGSAISHVQKCQWTNYKEGCLLSHYSSCNKGLLKSEHNMIHHHWSVVSMVQVGCGLVIIWETPSLGHQSSAMVLLRGQYSLDLKSWKTFLLVSHCFPWDRDSSLYLVNTRTWFLKRKTIQIPILCIIFVFASKLSNLVTSNNQ